jgi:hypothetical protein
MLNAGRAHVPVNHLQAFGDEDVFVSGVISACTQERTEQTEALALAACIEQRICELLLCEFGELDWAILR